jgi:TonB-dependent receptor
MTISKERGALGGRFWLGASTALITTMTGTSAVAQATQTTTPENQPSQAATGQNSNATQGKPTSAIVVTGRRAALRAADERKRRSETIIDSVVADEAGKLPDKSITEVLQRVSGVSIVRFRALSDPDHFSVEGSGVQVRGLSGVASRLNGRDIFSANNGRAILWGDVTPEMMAAVDVYKDSTADLIEGGTGGQIDLRTRLPFDYRGGVHFAATGDLSYGDLAKTKDPSISALITDRWHTPIGDIGVLADLAYSQLTTTSQFFRMESGKKTNIGGTDYYIPSGYDYGEEKFRRRRIGIYGALQWRPADSLLFTGTFFQSTYKNASGDWGAFVDGTLGVNPAQSKFDPNGFLISTPSTFVFDPRTQAGTGGAINSGGNKGFQRGRDQTRDMALSFNWTPSQFPVSVSGAIQRVDSTSKTDRIDLFRNVNYPTGYGFDITGNLPQITLPAGTDSAFFTNPANYVWTAAQPHNSDNKGRLDAANLDAEYKFDDSFFKSIKLGGRVSKRTERDLDNGYAWASLGAGWNGAPVTSFANSPSGDFEAHTYDNFFHGALDLPGGGTYLFPSQTLVSQLIYPQNLPQIFQKYGGTPGRAPGFILPQDQTNDLTDTKAAYALVRFGDDDWLNFAGNVGARFVWLKNRSTGYFQQNLGTTQFIMNGQTFTLAQTSNVVSGGASFTRLLPSVNLQVGPTRTTKIRFAYNITMDLPTFTALSAAGSLGVTTSSNPNNPPLPAPQLPAIFQTFTTTSGNPTLKPTMSHNLDLSFEWYPKPDSSAHLALFHKHINDLPIYTVAEQPITVMFNDGTSLATTAQAKNSANAAIAATVQGFEIGGRTFFSMLPGFLRGFGVDANYTYVDSKSPGDQYTDISGVVHHDVPVTGLSKHNFNVALLYELKPFSARIAYSWRSKYLQSTNANGTQPSYNYFFAAGAPSGTTCPVYPLQNAYCTHINGFLPIYGDAYGQVDAGIRYIVNDRLSFSVDGTNIFNATQRTLQGGYPNQVLYPRSWFQSDRRISVGANVAF